MDMIKEGSCWGSNNGKVFQVISRSEVDGHIWIFYRLLEKNPDEVKEFSCYEESFLERFHQLPECPKV
jgi:hypothetical protein